MDHFRRAVDELVRTLDGYHAKIVKTSLRIVQLADGRRALLPRDPCSRLVPLTILGAERVAAVVSCELFRAAMPAAATGSRGDGWTGHRRTRPTLDRLVGNAHPTGLLATSQPRENA